MGTVRRPESTSLALSHVRAGVSVPVIRALFPERLPPVCSSRPQLQLDNVGNIIDGEAEAQGPRLEAPGPVRRGLALQAVGRGECFSCSLSMSVPVGLRWHCQET